MTKLTFVYDYKTFKIFCLTVPQLKWALFVVHTSEYMQFFLARSVYSYFGHPH